MEDFVVYIVLKDCDGKQSQIEGAFQTRYLVEDFIGSKKQELKFSDIRDLNFTSHEIVTLLLHEKGACYPYFTCCEDGQPRFRVERVVVKSK